MRVIKRFLAAFILFVAMVILAIPFAIGVLIAYLIQGDDIFDDNSVIGFGRHEICGVRGNE